MLQFHPKIEKNRLTQKNIGSQIISRGMFLFFKYPSHFTKQRHNSNLAPFPQIHLKVCLSPQEQRHWPF